VGWRFCLRAAPATPQGTISAKGFLEIGSGTAIADLTSNAKFPDNPDVKYYYPYFEWNADASGDISTLANNAYGENYGVQMEGWFYPPSTGDYIFWVCSDDNSQLFLSTDEDPANKKLIAQEGGWSNPRIWDSVGSGDATTKNSSTFTTTKWDTKDPVNGGAKITLTKGKAYYIEALMKEGGGGDNLAVAVQDPGGLIDQTMPIPGAYLSPYSASAGAQILSQPTDRFVMVGGVALFSIGLDVPPSVTITSTKWTKNGVDIPDSNASSISIKAVAADDGSKIKAIVTTSAGTLTSDEVTLNVSPFTSDYTPGIAKAEFYTDVTGTTVETLTSNDKFLANTPDDVRILGTLSTPNAYGENYGAKVSGFLIPPTSGQFRFFLYSDDASELWLSPDDKEANAVKICEETDCCDAFAEPGTLNDDGVTSTTSEPQTLVAGKKYAFYAYLKEGTGGDYLQIAVRKEGDTTAAASLTPVSSAWLGANIRPTLGEPQITVQPTAPAQIEVGRDLTLSVDGVINPAGFNFPVIVKWQKDGQDIAGALGKTFTIPDTKTTDAGTYRAVVSAPNGNATNSTEVTIAVVQDITPPTILSAEGNPKHDQVTIHFSEAVDSATATALANYSVDGGLTLSTPVLQKEKDVVFTTPKQTAGTKYTITVSNVKDLFGTLIAANTKVSFLPATVASGLAAYWNFEGNLRDSAHDFHGTARGSDPLTYVDSKPGLGKALKLNGADQCVEVTGGDSANNLAFPGGSVSIAGWFKVETFDTSWQCLIARGEGNAWRVARNSANDTMSYAGGLTDVLGAKSVTDGNWHHFVAITDQTAANGWGTALYIDGSIDSTIEGTPALTLNANTHNVKIGENPDSGGREWNGELDEFAMWGRVLTEEEIGILYASGAGKPLSDFLPVKYRAGLNFGADEPSSANTGTLAATDFAGAPAVAQANWNNLSLLAGTNSAIVVDANGAAKPTTMTVSWTSANTWSSTGRGEENNQFTGADKNLMLGYLDTGNATTTTVTIQNVPQEITSAGYDVYVYALGGVAGRGGAYRILDANTKAVLKDYVRAQGPTNPSSYQQAVPSTDPQVWAVGNYILFSGLGAANITIEATTAGGYGFSGTPRAPINAIQLTTPASSPVPPSAPSVSVARTASGLTITFTGKLQTAPAVTGPWTDSTAASPLSETPSGSAKFYRSVK